MGPDGTVQAPLHLDELPAVVEALRGEAVESVGVCLLHAYANPVHERALREALAPHVRHVSVSSGINAEFRESERTCTTVVNASVMPLAGRRQGDLVLIETCGGGGYGPPAARPADLRERDRREGYLP